MQAARARRAFATAGLALAGLVGLAGLAGLSGGGRALAQLAVEQPRQRWRAGETVDLVLGGARGGRRIEAVLLDERAVDFEILGPGPRRGDVRLRLLLPEELKPGTHAISVLYRNPPPVETPPVTVPEIVGQEPAAAAALLAAAGLVLEAPAAPPGAVIRTQEPPAGALVPAGTRVTTEIAVGVPRLVGQELGRARSLLFARGLRPRITLCEAADGPYDTVLRQEPAAGVPVDPGSSVSLLAESRPDPPPPRWPWPWLVAAASLAALLGARLMLRGVPRGGYRLEAHTDRERLLAETTPPAWENGEAGLDLRLLGHADRGRQTLDIDGAAAGEVAS